ncbi:MAG: cytochrome-c peroxidase [Lishizhenia sp.]
MRQVGIYLLFVFLIYACKKDKVNYTPTPYVLNEPSHFPKMLVPSDNPLTVEGVELGRRLFYEEKLSGNNTMSCASCHAPNAAFSDPNQFSVGIDGVAGTRNSMALINLGYQNFFLWDGRAATLEEQILDPVSNPIELHEDWKNAVVELANDVNYKNLFYKAFGEEDFDSTHVSKAIAQFLRTMISGESKYDVMYKFENGLPLSSSEQEIWQNISNEEWAGFDLFKSLNGADCIHCHSGPLAQVQKFSNNGLDANFSDLGREIVTGNSNDRGKFKVPTLRNIALSGPYMHDGRFETLDEVIDHYSSGIIQSPTLDPLMEFASQGGVQLDNFEKQLLISFLNTLTDYNFINNPSFSDPGE